MEVQTPGLRERKHLETRNRLEEAAVTLVMKDGLDKTTIDAISEAANVSPRTFFNYFDSKEDALLGVHLPSGTEEGDITALQFNAEDDIVSSVVDLVVGFINPSRNSQRLKQKRVGLIRQYPALMEKQMSRLTKINDALNAKVKDMILIKDPTFNEVQATESSGVIVMACVGGVRTAVKEWLLKDTDAITDEVKQRAIKIINNAIKVL